MGLFPVVSRKFIQKPQNEIQITKSGKGEVEKRKISIL